MPKQKYYIQGMHCPSCELLIENEMKKIPGVVSADVSLSHKWVDFEYDKEKPDINELNEKFGKQGYVFFEQAPVRQKSKVQMGEIFAAALLVIGAFLIINKLGLVSFININQNSSLPAFFIFGLVAGISSCAALAGGLVLSLSESWNKESGKNKMEPHFLFNLGRLVSFSILGGILGFVGEKFIISPALTSVLILFVSAIMLILAFQMLGIKAFNRFRVAPAKSISAYVVGEKNLWKDTPFLIGFMTFLLPCGFTIVVEGAAILSGNLIKGSLIMLLFVLGTTVPLLVIGFSSNKFLSDKRLSDKFLKTAGILVIFFVIYNIDFQFGITRSLSENAVNQTEVSQTASGDAAKASSDSLTKDEQVIKAVYTYSSDIQPNTFEVKKGQRVRFEADVKENGLGCMSTIMIPGLWDTPLSLKVGKAIVMEFTPDKTGVYQITCAMGVPRGTIKVVE